MIMKNLRYLVLILSFSIMGCDTDDDGFYNRVYIDAAELVTIETAPAYNVGDIFWVNAQIPRLIEEPGEDTPLDLRLTTGNAPSFTFSFVLEKLNGSTWEVVDLTGNFVEDAGNAVVGSFALADAEFDIDQDAYDFRGGIELNSAGQYRLSFGYNSTSAEIVELISNSQGNNIRVNINSTVSQIDNLGYYSFTVN